MSLLTAIPSVRAELSRAATLLGGYGVDAQQSKKGTGEVKAIDRPVRIVKLVKLSGLRQSDLRRLTIWAFVVTALSLFGALLFHRLLFLVLAPVPLFVEWCILSRTIYKRAESFEREFTALLLALASSVKTGLDPVSALSEAANLFQTSSIMHVELKRFKTNIESGMVEEVAIRAFGDSINHPDISLFRAAFLLSRRQGSSLAGALQRLVRTTRQRQSFRRKIKAAVAMQKLSGMGIAGCCLIVTLIQYLSNPAGFNKALNHPMGTKLMTGGLILVVGGLLWMLRMTRSKI